MNTAELEAANVRLTAEIASLMRGEQVLRAGLQAMRKLAETYQCEIDRLTAENKALTERIGQLETFLTDYKDTACREDIALIERVLKGNPVAGA